MNEGVVTKVFAITAVIFVASMVVALPYQNHVANAAPAAKKYQFFVTLTDVPANAEDLEMNVTVTRGLVPIALQVKTVSSPSEGDVVKFTVRVPSGSNEESFFVCGMRVNSHINSCDHHSLPSTGGGPIRVDYVYP